MQLCGRPGAVCIPLTFCCRSGVKATSLHLLLQIHCQSTFHAFCAAGLEQKDVVFKVSSRTVLSAILESFGVPTDHIPSVFLIIDKMDKMPREEVSLVSLQRARCKHLDLV